MELRQRVAIVTGSASGIGAATAIALARRGCNVVINYTRNEADAEETAAACTSLGVEAMLCRADVSSDDDCRRMVAAAAERWGRLDVLVNSAGTTKFVPHSNLDGLDAEDFQRIYAVNTIGPFQMARAAAPHMRSAGAGAIVNVSSGAGIYGRGSSIAYGASKGALNNLTLALARVLAPEIRVNAVCPTLVDTRWMRTLMGEDYEKRIAATRAKVPLHKVCSPEDVAETILWLVAGAGTMTGELILMDGGQHLL